LFLFVPPPLLLLLPLLLLRLSGVLWCGVVRLLFGVDDADADGGFEFINRPGVAGLLQ